jgi:hypothetical protein
MAFERQAVAASPGQRVDDLAVDVDLQLICRRVADPDRPRCFIPGQPWQLVLGEPPLTSNPVHDLQVVGLPPIARSSQSRHALASST